MNNLPIIRHIRLGVRAGMARFATWFVKATGGKVTAVQITWIGVLAHIPIAYLIAKSNFYWAVPLLIIFGLLDSLDGAVARASKKASPAGMVLDAFTDRLKETLIHAPLVYFLASNGHTLLAVLPAAALGIAISTNYLKAKAEVAYQVNHPGEKTLYEINTLFSDGALSFEVRTAVILIGMLIGTPSAVAICEAIVAVGVWQTPKDMKQILSAIRGK